METRRQYRCPSTDAERGALAEILANSFAFEADKAGAWFDLAGHVNLRGYWAGDEMVGGLLGIPMGQFFGGRTVATCGIAGVGIATDRRRQGHASGMMRACLAELKASGYALSTLYASNQPLYRGVGYEQAGSAHRAEIRPTDVRVVERSLSVRTLTGSDTPSVDEIHRVWAKQTAGALDRGPYVWGRVRERQGKPTHGLGLVNEAGDLEGYLYTATERTTGDRHNLQILDVGFATPRAVRAAWTAIGDMGTMVRRVQFNTGTADPFLLAQHHPLASVRLYENWMVRVLDTPTALAARGYAPGLRGQVDLDIDDPDGLCGGRFRLTVEGGDGEARPGGDGNVRLDRRGLAAIYTGFLSPRQVVMLGWGEGTTADLDQLGAFFAGPQPWLRDHF
jgi:predicted acetyltransferase